MQAAVDYLMAKMPKAERPNVQGKVVIGQAYGDIHSIGKNLIVACMHVWLK